MEKCKTEWMWRYCRNLYKDDKKAARQAMRSLLKHYLILDGLWIPRRVEHGQRLYAEEA